MITSERIMMIGIRDDLQTALEKMMIKAHGTKHTKVGKHAQLLIDEIGDMIIGINTALKSKEEITDGPTTC